MKNLSSKGLDWEQKLLNKSPRILLLQSCLHPARVTASDTRSRPWLLTGVSRSTTHLCYSHVPPGRQLQATQCAPNLEWCNNVRHMPHENRCTTGAAHTGHKTYSIQSCWFYDDIGYYHLVCLGVFCCQKPHLDIGSSVHFSGMVWIPLFLYFFNQVIFMFLQFC